MPHRNECNWTVFAIIALTLILPVFFIEVKIRMERDHRERGPCLQVIDKHPNNIIEFVFANETRVTKTVSDALYQRIWRSEFRHCNPPHLTC